MTDTSQDDEWTEMDRLARAATPQNLASAEIHDTGESMDCPFCDGDGSFDVETFTNYDGVAIGVQFFGVGDEHVAAHELYKALTPPTILRLIAAARGAREDLGGGLAGA